jgi:hypothetical protein
MTNSRSRSTWKKETQESDNQPSCFDCASALAYDVLRFLREHLSGGGVAAGGEGSFSSLVSGHVICVDSSSSLSRATTSGECSCGWVGSDSVRELGAGLLGV